MSPQPARPSRPRPAPSPWISPSWKPSRAHRRRVWRTVVFGLWLILFILVVVGSLLPASSPALQTLGRLHISDKVIHASAYLALSLLPMLACREPRAGLAAGFAMFVLGAILEESQRFSPGRTPDVKDAAANAAGIALGLLLGACARPLLRLRSRRS